MTIKSCRYCYGTIHIQRRHTTSCIFNPQNNRILIEYLENLVKNNQEFVIKEYDKYAKTQKLPLSKTIVELFRLNGFIKPSDNMFDAIVYIIYRSYELNLVDNIELLDMIVYKLTYGIFKFSGLDYSNRIDQICTKANIPLDKLEKCYQDLVKKVLEEE